MSFFDGWWRNYERIEAASTQKAADKIAVFTTRMENLEASVGAGAEAYSKVLDLQTAFDGFKRGIDRELEAATKQRKSAANSATAAARGKEPTLTFTETELRTLIQANVRKFRIDNPAKGSDPSQSEQDISDSESPTKVDAPPTGSGKVLDPKPVTAGRPIAAPGSE